MPTTIIIRYKLDLAKLNFDPKKIATLKERDSDMELVQWVCTCCGYVYDPEQGDPTQDIPPGTPFDDLPDEWRCPVCLALKKAFDQIDV